MVYLSWRFGRAVLGCMVIANMALKHSTYIACQLCDVTHMYQGFPCTDCGGRGYVKEGSEAHARQRAVAVARSNQKRQAAYKRKVRANAKGM